MLINNKVQIFVKLRWSKRSFMIFEGQYSLNTLVQLLHDTPNLKKGMNYTTG